MRNEKLVPTTLPDPKKREPYLPKPNGDNKLTAEMVPYYTGKYIIQRAILILLSRCFIVDFICAKRCLQLSAFAFPIVLLPL